MRELSRVLFTATVLCLVVFPAADASEELFRKKVAPVFERRCLGCHSDSKRKGKLSMASRAALLKGGRKGQVVVPGDPAASRLLQLITPKDGKASMPKNKAPLSEAELAAVGEWIKAGAPWPQGLALGGKSPADFNWWSFKKLERPEVPRIEGASAAWVRTPIDAFIRSRLDAKGLAPAPEADRLTLIRRLSF
ncbi:MAG: c-type cytochrome domain-containing protein, partial [Planctomycetota bacterium]|nr:c-type cytochrome domain-containing protein [Planctomycetota bacterium]